VLLHHFPSTHHHHFFTLKKIYNMKQQPVTLAIPTPCHEDWQKMTPAEQGRFCLSCQKTVMDFTGKTDREVAKYFEQGSANTCGRFRHDQLQRPLHAMQPNGFGNRLRALGIMVPGLLLGGWAQAQNNKQLMGKVACPRPNTTNVRQVLGDAAVVPATPKTLIGDTIVVENPAFHVIRGIVMDNDRNEPLIGANVVVENTALGTVTAMDGSYELKIPSSPMNPTLVYSFTGYNTLKQTIAPNQDSLNVRLEMAPYPEGVGILVGMVISKRKDQTLYNILRHKTRRFMENLMASIADRRAEKAIAKQQAKLQAEPTLSIPTAPATNQPAYPTPHEALAVEVFPNPFDTRLSLRFDSPLAERLTIRLVDMLGRTVLIKQYEAMKGPQVLTLESQGIHLLPGQYLLEMSNGEVLHYAGMVVKGGA
jgi:CarboxypepD_reg-like domain